jgi:transposase
MAAMARPSSLTPAVTEKVCEALKLGVSWDAAAAHAGIGATTIHRWLAQAAEDEEGGPFWEFREQTTRARNSAETRMAAIVMKAAQEGSASAAQWWLERRRPETWSSKQTVTVDTPDPSRGIAALLGKLAEPGEGG